MRKAVFKTMFFTIMVFALFSAFCIVSFASSATSEATVPMLTRHYIQHQYSNENLNNNHYLFITVLVFAAVAIAIPATFFMIDKIKAEISKNTLKQRK